MMDGNVVEHAIRTVADLEKAVSDHEGHITGTFDDQEDVEQSILEQYRMFAERSCDGLRTVPLLFREKHISFLRKGLIKQLSDSYEALDASRPWLCYWILHALNLLGCDMSEKEARQISRFLVKCQDFEQGGFGGGPAQKPHLAASYAAINALACLGNESAFSVIDRELLFKFILSMKLTDGSFRMHHGGEVDVRAVYCAVVVAKLANITSKDLFVRTPEWIIRCQTYEGGFGGYPGMEAHGGYTFCAIACLILLGKQDMINQDGLLRWLSLRQMSLEGGFSGRTNKLVDGCYAFWQGASCALLGSINPLLTANSGWIFNESALQEYLLICCQQPLGGLIDKPGKQRDYYHTCYALSGLSVSQHSIVKKKTHLGSTSNFLRPVDPLCNLTMKSAEKIQTYFQQFPSC